MPSCEKKDFSFSWFTDGRRVLVVTHSGKANMKEQYAAYQMNRQLIVSKYQLYLLSVVELRAEIEREREMVVRERVEWYGAGENS